MLPFACVERKERTLNPFLLTVLSNQEIQWVQTLAPYRWPDFLEQSSGAEKYCNKVTVALRSPLNTTPLQAIPAAGSTTAPIPPPA